MSRQDLFSRTQLCDQIDGGYDSAIFTAEKISQPFEKAFKANKAIQDYVFTDGYAVDGQSTERKFVSELDSAEEVVVYAKLPKGFSIRDHQNPLIAFVYPVFMRTKREIEQAKRESEDFKRRSDLYE